jgi:hypothetical protein
LNGINLCSESWYGKLSLKKLSLLFFDVGAKIDQHYYFKHLLQDHHFNMPRRLFLLSTNSELSHKAMRIQKWLTENVPDFSAPQYWSVSSPDLNPLEYFAWKFTWTISAAENT